MPASLSLKVHPILYSPIYNNAQTFILQGKKSVFHYNTKAITYFWVVCITVGRAYIKRFTFGITPTENSGPFFREVDRIGHVGRQVEDLADARGIHRLGTVGHEGRGVECVGVAHGVEYSSRRQND